MSAVFTKNNCADSVGFFGFLLQNSVFYSVSDFDKATSVKNNQYLSIIFSQTFSFTFFLFLFNLKEKEKNMVYILWPF